MRLFIAEKPSLARAIAAVLPQPQKASRLYIEAGNDVVAWAAGHLLEQAMQEKYDEKYKRWSLADLPIIPEEWKMLVKKESRDLFDNLKTLLKKADSVVNAGDCDREGQLLIDEILEHCKYRGPVQRILISDTNPDAVRKALAELKPNEDFRGDRDAARARSQADWLHGMNMTRLYTKLAEKNGYDGGPLRIGRVKTPVTALVVRRDLEIESFVPKPYWTLQAQIQVEKGAFWAGWRPKEEQTGLDEEGRLVDKATGEELASRLKGKPAVITKYESKKQSVKPPLGYSLPKLQMAASRKHDMSPSRVLEVCQKLYEHGVLTYPRSDCEYLPEGHQDEAEKVLAVIDALSSLKRPDELNTARKTPVFNGKKVEEHHAIIPSASCRVSKPLEGDEALIFELVARRYLAFFMPDHEYMQTSITAEVEGEMFVASGRRVLAEGWKAVERNDEPEKDDDKEGKEEEQAALPVVSEGEQGECRDTKLQEKQTKAPARFTEASLLRAMNEVHKFVADPKVKKILRETDGIGTAATQAGILKDLITFGQLQKQKKQLISTPAARSLIQALPEAITLPDLTALWETKFRAIKEGTLSIEDMMEQMATTIRESIAQAGSVSVQGSGEKKPVKATKKTAPKAGKGDVKCPKCGAKMVLRNGKNGPFWGCGNYPTCRATADDDGGKPVFKKQH